MVDVFANAPLALESVVHLSCGTLDERCYMGFDFLHHAGEVSCVYSIGLTGDTKPDLLLCNLHQLENVHKGFFWWEPLAYHFRLE